MRRVAVLALALGCSRAGTSGGGVVISPPSSASAPTALAATSLAPIPVKVTTRELTVIHGELVDLAASILRGR